MQTFENFDIVRYNTMHLHCIAKIVFIPESEEELINLLNSIHKNQSDCYFLGAGSNIILPPIITRPVVILTSFNKTVSFENGLIECGASVRIQHLIREAQKKNYGGLEYLFSVPCSVGGATIMNAGRGKKYNQSVGNYVVSVKCYNLIRREIELLTKEQCCYSYRNSIFLKGDRIVLSVILSLEPLDKNEIEERIQERKRYAAQKLDDRRPSSGSIFNKCDSRIMKKLMGLRIGGARWSQKKANWISNVDNAKCWQILILIRIACLLHILFFKPYHVEVEIWKK